MHAVTIRNSGMNDLTQPIATICASVASTKGSCSIRITGTRTPDELVGLRREIEAAGFTQSRCTNEGAGAVCWTLERQDTQGILPHDIDSLSAAIKNAGMMLLE